MTLYEAAELVRPADREAMRRAQQRWSQVAKPLDSLGVLEADLVRIAGVQRTPDISLEEKWIAVMCADNGIVAEGVTQTGQEVTAAVAERMGRRASCVCLMAARAGARIFPVDVGIASRERIEGLLERKVRRGTEDFLKGPAMRRAEAVRAAECGVETAGILADQGCRLAGAGEMGIGNTTTSSALISVFLGITPREAAGRGAGLSDAGYRRKVQVIEEGIRKNRPDPSDPLDVLAKVGGLDLAALAGFYIGCAARGIPVVLDGLITGAAALAAVRLCPAAGEYLLASHVSAEPAGKLVLEALGLRAAIDAGMCLGEGCGAAVLFPLLDMAAEVYGKMETFDQMQVEQYERFETEDGEGKSR